MNKYPKLINAKHLSENHLEGKVIEVPVYAQDKPNIALLGEKELVMFTSHQHTEQAMHGGALAQHPVMYRSHDGGLTWERGKHLPFMGYEPSVSVIDGVLLVQTQWCRVWETFYVDGSTTPHHFCNTIYRSEDGGETWTEFKVDEHALGYEKPYRIGCSRNFVKLSDGSVIGMCNYANKGNWLMRSEDLGKTWNMEPIAPVDFMTSDAFHGIAQETYLYLTPSGRLLGIFRVHNKYISRKDMPYLWTAPDDQGNDQTEGMILLESHDWGHSWEAVRALCYASMMYPSVLYLDERNFILTYTLRDSRVNTPYPHMGVQAVLGCEREDGSFDIDFDHDIIVIDDYTPDCAFSAGGFGRTEMLSDGSLITPYSYMTLPSYSYMGMVPSLEQRLMDGSFREFGFYREMKIKTKTADPATIDTPEKKAWWESLSDNMKRIIIMTDAPRIGEAFQGLGVLKWNIKRDLAEAGKTKDEMTI